MTDLSLEATAIPGLLVLRLPVHADHRGWFKENWQRAKMTALGLPDFGPVQNNMSFNERRGATRGIHTEPWDKLVSVAVGRVFAAWVDMRAGDSFGTTFHLEIGPDTSVFVPRGVGNSYQALENGSVYSYLVNDHYVAGRTYPALNLADPAAAIPWPISLDSAEVDISPKDRGNPILSDVEPMAPRRTLITGCHGQLGRALAAEFPGSTLVDIDDLDLTDAGAVASFPWRDYGLVLNAAAYTAVDAAENDGGRRVAWAANAAAPAMLASLANEHRLTLVHYSSDYVFDGQEPSEGHDEHEPMAPLGVYAQSKAAGDLAISTCTRHYILRTSWVIGDGYNFVRTMKRLADDGVSPDVVDDQVGRLTFTTELARATRHLLDSRAAFGTYNVTNSGTARSWAGYAARIFELCGRSPEDVTPISTEQYVAGKVGIAPRPRHSVLSLAKLEATGYRPEDADAALDGYVSGLCEA